MFEELGPWTQTLIFWARLALTGLVLKAMLQEMLQAVLAVKDHLRTIDRHIHNIQLHQQVLLDSSFLQPSDQPPEEKLERLAIQAESTNNQLLAASFASAEMWSRPLFEILNFTSWHYLWTRYTIARTGKQRDVLQLVPPIYCYVYLDVRYENLTFVQSARNVWTYYCFYGDKLIGFYKIGGQKRSSGKFLRNVCMNPNAWLISSRALRVYSLQNYTAEAFEAKVQQGSNGSKPLYLYSESNLEAERKLLADGRHHPELMYMSFINLMFRYFIYQSYAKKVEYLYGHQEGSFLLRKTLHKNGAEESHLREFMPSLNLDLFDLVVEGVRAELEENNYSFVYCSDLVK